MTKKKTAVAIGVALTGYDHHGSVKKAQPIYDTDYSKPTLDKLVDAGFIKLNSASAAEEAKANEGKDADPQQGAGTQPSASPVAPASQKQTAKESKSGANKKGGKGKK